MFGCIALTKVRVILDSMRPQGMPRRGRIGRRSRSSKGVASFGFIRSSGDGYPISIRCLRCLASSESMRPSEPSRSVMLQDSIVSEL